MKTRMATRLALLLVALLLGAGCGADPAAPGSRTSSITDGIVYSGHPSVGRLALTAHDGKTYTCTGTLVGQRTVLTAGHCIWQKANATFHVGGGAYAVGQMVLHPDYTVTPTTVSSDIAVLRLNTSPSVTPTPVATQTPWVGLPLTLIGFGVTGDGLDDSGVKRMAHNAVADVKPLRFNMRGTGGSIGNICDGDSGGPAFAMNGQEVQVGVHSYGESTCGVSEWDTWVDGRVHPHDRSLSEFPPRDA
jgi:secreted trypsin-like serine protease